MNKLPLLLRHLTTQVTDELEAQRRLLELLDAQELAIQAAKPAEIIATGRAVEAEAAATARRARHRDVLLTGFANLWNVKPGTLTFSSVIERAGPAAAALRETRDELRAATARVMRKARRIRTLAAAHQRLTLEILEALFAPESGGSVVDGGRLVNAEA